MKWIDIPTEQTTAVTDLVLAVLGVCSFIYLGQFSSIDMEKVNIWRWALVFLTAAALLGFFAHGFKMSPKTNNLLWQPLNLCLGLAIAFFVVGVVYDLWGMIASKTAAPVMIIVGIIFFGITRFFPGSFLVFILYEAAAMLFALGAYLFLAVGGESPGAWWMAASIVIMVIAAAIQATERVHMKFIWQFDFNGVFHLVQMVGIIMLLVGLTIGLTT